MWKIRRSAAARLKIHMAEKNKSFLIARNSIFSRFSVYCDAIFMQNCTIADSRLGAAELIVRDSSLSGAEVLSTVKGYLVYNLYSSGKGGAGNSAHALGRGKYTSCTVTRLRRICHWAAATWKRGTLSWHRRYWAARPGKSPGAWICAMCRSKAAAGAICVC